MTREELLKTAKPILFNTEMVRAILEDRKTVTRRVIKPQPNKCVYENFLSDKFAYDDIAENLYCMQCGNPQEYQVKAKIKNYTRKYNAPYKVGDILYVRETWCKLHPLDDNMCTPIGDDKYYYAADGYNPTPFNSFPDENGYCGDRNSPRWKPSIHMPKEAARIFLKVTDVRAERLQDITEAHIKTEGTPFDLEIYEMPCNIPNAPETYLRGEFMRLWNSTIKKQDLDRYGWNANPWVWVIEFERVKTDGL